jgi:hypothetical protein
MWQLLLDFDLTRKVVAAARPSDEPLRWMLDSLLSRMFRTDPEPFNTFVF